MPFKQSLFILGTLFMIGIVFALWWAHYLHLAHSSFENYYNFRGCQELLEKKDTFAYCKLSSGNIIKLVKIDSRWFLDGDTGW